MSGYEAARALLMSVACVPLRDWGVLSKPSWEGNEYVGYNAYQRVRRLKSLMALQPEVRGKLAVTQYLTWKYRQAVLPEVLASVCVQLARDSGR